MADRSGTSIIEQIERDRIGIDKQINDIRKDMSELQKQLLMAKGAKLYIEQLLEKLK